MSRNAGLDPAAGPGRHRAAGPARTSPGSVLRVLTDNPVGDGLQDGLAVAVVLASWAGLTALYRAAPTAAVVVTAGLVLVVAAGVASIVWRRPGRSRARQVCETVATFAVAGLGSAAATAGPVWAADRLLSAVL